MRGIRRKRGWGFRAAVVLLICGILYAAGDAAFRPALEQLARNRAEQLVPQRIASVMLRLQEEQPGLFENLTRVEEYGGVRTLRIDAAAANRLKSEAVLAVAGTFGGSSGLQTGIPLGSLTGIQLLSGTGPEIPVRFRAAGAASCDFRSEFHSGGLNQTVHRLLLEFRVDLAVLLPLHVSELTCVTDYLISETVIVGEVPSGGFFSASGAFSPRLKGFENKTGGTQ